MSEERTLKLRILIAVDEDGNYAVGKEGDCLDELASGADLRHPVSTYEIELEVPVPSPVKASAKIVAEPSGPLRFLLKRRGESTG